MTAIPQSRSLCSHNGLIWLLVAVIVLAGLVSAISSGMPMFTACSTLSVLYVIGSLLYVYRFRGQERCAGVSEYIRKGWPIFAPFNCLLYAMTQRRAQRPIMNLAEFRELDPIIANWQTIRDEALQLQHSGIFEAIAKPGSQSYYDVGFRTFYKYGWSKFYLKWYGCTHNSARKFCPKTVKILSQVRMVNGAMFSLLPAGSHLTRHLDPVACSLRFHLGLATPQSDACFINIDGQTCSWRDGEAVLFDETYLHFARNDSQASRLILMCDVDRPMNAIGKLLNGLYKIVMRLTIVPNIEGDRRGLANRLFSCLSPVLVRTKALKSTNRKLYVLLKYTVNVTLLAMVTGIVAGLFFLASWLVAVL
jgi:beta-hydroxylase